MNITLELVRDEWNACYPASRLAALYDRPRTPLEVLTRDDGEWATVPANDRLWTVLREGVLPDRTLRLFACECATRALNRERAAGREPDARSWIAIDVARRHADGQASDDELAAARDAARATETSEQLKILVAMLRGSDATTEASVRA